MKFITSSRPVGKVLTPVAPFALARGELAIIEDRPNGETHFMTYRSERGARLGLRRAQAEIPLARIATYDAEGER